MINSSLPPWTGFYPFMVPPEIDQAIALISDYLNQQDVSQITITRHGKFSIFATESEIMRRLKSLEKNNAPQN